MYRAGTKKARVTVRKPKATRGHSVDGGVKKSHPLKVTKAKRASSTRGGGIKAAIATGKRTNQGNTQESPAYKSRF